MVVEQTSRGERASTSIPVCSTSASSSWARRSPRTSPNLVSAQLISPGVRGPGQGRLDLRQLSGRLGLCRARDLRHDAVHQARRADHLRRGRDVDGRAAARGRCPGQADGARRTRRSSSTRSRAASRARLRTSKSTPARSSTFASGSTRSSRTHTGQDLGEGREGHGARLLHERRGSGRVPHRSTASSSTTSARRGCGQLVRCLHAWPSRAAPRYRRCTRRRTSPSASGSPPPFVVMLEPAVDRCHVVRCSAPSTFRRTSAGR